MQYGANLKSNWDLRAVPVQNDASGAGSSHSGIGAILQTGRDRPSVPDGVVPVLWWWCMVLHWLPNHRGMASGATEWRIPGIFDLFCQAVSHIFPGYDVIYSRTLPIMKKMWGLIQGPMYSRQPVRVL